MSVSLKKGQKVNLQKETSGHLTSVMVGLGWDEAEHKSGFFASLFGGGDIDCDASAFLCQNGRLVDKTDIVYFGNLSHKSGCVRHMGDNLTGAGEGDDEQILVNLQDLPAMYDRIIFVVNIYMARARKQHFGMIRNAFIRICDDKGKELCKYHLSEKCDNMTAMIFGEMNRRDGVWEFSAIGEPTKDDSVDDLAKKYQ